jgi:antitoxin ParD1/3/4
MSRGFFVHVVIFLGNRRSSVRRVVAGWPALANLANKPILWSRGAPMPTRNVNLPDKLDQFISAKVASGDYANASEVMRAALRLMEKEEREYDEKMAILRAAIAEGDASPDAEGDVFEQIYAYIDELAGEKGENVA